MATLMTSPVMSTLRKEVDRLFDRVWEGKEEISMLNDWCTAVDVSETADAVTAQVDLPGVDVKDLRLSVRDQQLMVRGEKRRMIERKDANFFMSERSYGAFARTIALPAPVDATKVKATFKNGVLTVAMEKATEARGTTININVA